MSRVRLMIHFYKISGEEEGSSGDTQILGIHWPFSLATKMTSETVRDTVSRNKEERGSKKTANVNF